MGNGEMEHWFFIAHNEIGVSEKTGAEHNARILEYHSVTTYKAESDEIAWCSSFVCWCFEQAGITSTKSAAAKSWLKWGYELKEPRDGCVVVFEKDGKFHVALWKATKAHLTEVLGGNQSNRVCIMGFRTSTVKSYRWPTPVE